MPLILDKKQLSNIKETQQSCQSCEKGSLRNESVVLCDICNIWSCKECSQINEKLIETSVKHNVKLSYVCLSCEEEAPKIRSLMKISQRQDEMEAEIKEVNGKTERNTALIIQIQEDNSKFETRMKALEKVIKDNKLSEYIENYPPLIAMTEKLSTQEGSTAKLNDELQKQVDEREEEFRKASKSQNLIIYGIPENESDPVEQMKYDFSILSQVYENKVEIQKTDITQIIRIGKKNPSKIRPIKITCANNEIRKEILTNNKFLRMEGEMYNTCNCKVNPGKHIHINITTDKTKKEQEEEARVIKELKDRREAGENVIIKRGKVVNRENVTKFQARWTEILQNGL